MALPSTGLITITDIMVEYGKTGVVALSDFYGTSGYPTSGLITLSDFYGKANTLFVTISSSIALPNVRSIALTAGWDGAQPLVVNITAPYVNTLNLGNIPFTNGITLNISASSLIGGVRSGGNAFTTGVPVTVNNLGTIAGAGGHGQQGRTRWVRYSSSVVTGQGGSGGAGAGFANSTAITPNDAQGGDSGSTGTYSGAILGGQTRPYATGGDGGYGGEWGESGGSGGFGSVGGSYDNSGSEPPGPRGTPGNSVTGNSFITWVNTGTRLGPIVN